MFINDIGVSWDFGPKHLNERFFKAHVAVFGGTALVPALHDGLTSLLARAKQAGCITVVNTVYDFRSELRSPGHRWPMGNDDESYRLIDLIIMDREEALHLSGTGDLTEAGRFFIKQGVSSMLITDGTGSTHCFSSGRLFQRLELQSFPVSSALMEDLRQLPGGDTTGCGDNFVGGALAALAWQLQENKGLPNLLECLAWGTVSGGYCCFHVGGTLIEMEPGEKLELIRPYYHRYKNQIIG
jgi:sugar/nucleoside kinase (ribokinase family)